MILNNTISQQQLRKIPQEPYMGLLEYAFDGKKRVFEQA